EEAEDVTPRAIGHLGLIAAAQEAVPHSRIDLVGIVLPGRFHGGGGIVQARVDARVILSIHAETFRANLRHRAGLGGGSIADHEGLELGRVSGVAEALPTAPAESDDPNFAVADGLELVQ